MCKYDFVKYLRKINRFYPENCPHFFQLEIQVRMRNTYFENNISKQTVFIDCSRFNKNNYINILICVRKYRINTRIKYGDVDVSIKGFLTAD